MPTREFSDSTGRRWRAAIISHGRTSAYLNPKVHRPIVEFSSLDGSLPKRYARLPAGADSLEGVDDPGLVKMLGKSKVH